MTIRYELFSSVPVKPDLIRFDVEVYEDDQLQSGYEIVLHTNEYTTFSAKDGVVEMRIDLGELQQKLTQAVTAMAVTAGIASAIDSQKLQWEVNIDEPTIPDGMQVAHGDSE